MEKNKYDINKNDIELTFQHISHYIDDKKWWKDEKKRLKAIKIYKKLNLEKLFNLTKKDKDKYGLHFLSTLSDWCKRCINSKQWKKLKQSVNQIQLRKKELGQKKNISISNKAYELLHHASRQENTSVSELIVFMLEHRAENLTAKINNNKLNQITEKTEDNEADEVHSITYEKIKKGNQYIIELWHYAGGQCQALSKATQKRCKRITPELSMNRQTIGDTVYEFSVCHTHTKETSLLDPTYICPES